MISIAKKLEEEEFNELAAEILTKLLGNEDILAGVLKAMPESWEYSEQTHGDNPTKYDFAWSWLWLYIQE